MLLRRLRPDRELLETLLVLSLAMTLGAAIALTSDLSAKYLVVGVIGIICFGVLCQMPERRIACVVLWVLIHPLSMEKVYYINAPIGPQFADQAIVFNVSDVILLLLGIFLVIERAFRNEKVFHWPSFATFQGLLLVWAAVSFAIHSVFLQDGLDVSAPITLLHYARTLVFMVLLFSGIRTRGDVLAVLLAILLIIAVESVLVGMSYATGIRQNFTKFTGSEPDLSLQTFSGSEGTEVRAAATLGHTNQQAMFHALFTPLLVALFMVRRSFWRFAALIGIAGSTLALVLTFSRTGWIAITLAFGLIFLNAWRNRMISKTGWLAGGLMAVAITIALGALAQPIYERIAHGDDGATASRLRMVNLALDLFTLNPILGVGPGEFAEATLKYFPPEFRENEWVAVGEKPIAPTVGRLEVGKFTHNGYKEVSAPLPVHNKYLLSLSELGVFGLVLFLGIYYSFAKSALRCSRSVDPLLKMVGIGGLGMILGSVVYMGFDLFADDKSVELLMFCPLFVAAAARVVEQREGKVGGAAGMQPAQAAVRAGR